MGVKDPQRDQGSKDAVQPPIDHSQRLHNDVLREEVGERQLAVLEELTPQKAHPLAKPPWATMAPVWGLLTGNGLVANNHLRKLSRRLSLSETPSWQKYALIPGFFPR